MLENQVDLKDDLEERNTRVGPSHYKEDGIRNFMVGE